MNAYTALLTRGQNLDTIAKDLGRENIYTWDYALALADNVVSDKLVNKMLGKAVETKLERDMWNVIPNLMDENL